jgi:hypothetical protein
MKIPRPVPILLILIILSCAIPASAAAPEDYDHYVSFHMRANSLATTYAYDLITRGEPSDSSRWVYNIYMFGYDGDGQTGRIAVFGGDRNLISPVSVPLSPGTDYYIVWQYSAVSGGELFVNDISQGPPVGSGSLPVSRSASFHVGEDMYTGDGRQHSPFNGAIWGFSHYEKDLGGAPAAPAAADVPGLIMEKQVAPWSIKQNTETVITITLTNNGTTPVHDIEIKDETLPEFPVTGTGSPSAILPVLEPGETSILSYTVTGTTPGRYVLGKARALYAGEDGNYYQISSGAPSVVILEPVLSQGYGNAVTSSRGDILKPFSDFLDRIFQQKKDF